jgi:signal transduction histidine kinase
MAFFKLNDLSIRNKLILMQVFTSLLVLSIVFGVFIITDMNSYKQRKVDSMINLSQVIASNSISAIQFQDAEAARDMLAELHKVSPDIIHAGIRDTSGKIFASYVKVGADTLTTPTFRGKHYVFGNRQLYISNPIVSNGENMGTVFLEVRLTELEQIIQFKLEITLLLLLMALVLSFLIALIVQSYISRRLLYLVKIIRDVRKTGDYPKPVVDNGKDELSELTREFSRLMQQIEQNQQRKDEFIGIASHELKTPLTSVKGYLELLSVRVEVQPDKQFVQKALQNVNKLESLIKDLLDVSKIQSGQLQLNFQLFNIDELLNETISSFQLVSSTHQIIRKDRLDNEMIFADRQRIEQVLVNLLSNAIKYSPGESEVFVNARKEDNQLIIKVKDFGIGIPPEEQSNIFERFYRTKDLAIHISGFGLGLYICRDIINRHHGKIWVETEEKGSAFYFSLPLEIPVVNEKTLNNTTKMK